MSITVLVNDNVVVLQNITKLLQELDAAQYQRKDFQTANSSIGQHVRHIIDHYFSITHAVVSSTNSQACNHKDLFIDYDNRQRDIQIEQDKNYSHQVLKQLAQQLVDLTCDVSVIVKQQTGTEQNKPVQSTLARELMFAHSHTTHHLAIIKMQLIELGITVTHDLGVAPSTLAYQTATSTLKSA